MITQHPTAPSTATPAQVFQERVCRLPGVLSTEIRDSAGLEPVIVVYL